MYSRDELFMQSLESAKLWPFSSEIKVFNSAGIFVSPYPGLFLV